MRSITALAALAAALVAPAGALAQEGEVKVSLDPAAAGKASRLSLEASGRAVSSGQQSPRSVSVFVAHGFRFDSRARGARCNEEQRRRLDCPAASRIGGGFAEGEATFLLQKFPFRATIDVFLGDKAERGDVAGIVVVVREPRSGRSGSGRGRLLRSGDPGFGHELRFDNLPAAQAPPGASAELKRLSLTIGANRTVRRKRTIRRRRTVRRRGKRRRVIRKRRVVRKRRYNLIRNPATCPGSWPYRVRVSFQGSETVRDGSVPCSA